MTEIALDINGMRHLGWTEVRIRSGLDRVADQFELTLTERWGRDRGAQRPIQAGAPCRLTLDGERVVTGHVDDVLPKYDADQHRITVVGRSLTADLVDCSGRARHWERPRTLEQVARAVAKPFGIEVRAEADTGQPLREPAIEAGQPYYEALAQMARYRGVTLTTDPRGRLVITQPPRARLSEALVLGENIRAGDGRFSTRERFSDVIVQGQQPDTPTTDAATHAESEGAAKDEGVGRYRPMLLVGDTAVDTDSCRQRARDEVRRRRGRSRGVTYTVAGWRHAEGLWRAGDQVRVRDPWLGVDAWRVIEGVQRVLDNEGERTELRVVPPEAWDLTAEPEPEPQRWGWG